MFLVNVQEALGLTYEQTLDSSYALIQSLLTEYSYLWNERNKQNDDEENSDEFEWVELTDWDNPTQKKRVKKYKDLGHLIPEGKF